VGDADIRWFGPTRESDVRALERWCSAVGPPVVDAKPSRELLAGETLADLRVVTWNVHVGGGDLDGFLRDELGYECAADDGRGFGGHFVILVQEAYRTSDLVPPAPEGSLVAGRIEEHPEQGPRIDIVESARGCGLAVAYVPSMRNGHHPAETSGEDRGNAILSTLPLTDLVAFELPLEAQRRVALAATVRGPGDDPLRVVSVHFDVAGNLLRVLGTGGSMRVRQSEGLTEALDTMDPERRMPTVLAGDLNTWSASETVIQRLQETFPQSPDPGRAKTRSDFPADHLFYRRGDSPVHLVEGSYVVIPDSHGSDHKARMAVFRR
jgi:endonuclease/exonuclease/phosphatase family metal-dependent hydrolase